MAIVCDSCGEIVFDDGNSVVCDRGLFCSPECSDCKETCTDYDYCEQRRDK